MSNNSHDNFPDWHQHEKDVADYLQADQTTASGSVWYDKADVTTREHPEDREVQFLADAKSTHFNKYSLDCHFLEDNRKRAILAGKIFLLPVRFELTPDRSEKFDYVVLSMDDFKFLTGLDEFKEYRKASDKRKKSIDACKAKLSKVIESIYNIADDPNLSSYKRSILYKTCDEIESSMSEL